MSVSWREAMDALAWVRQRMMNRGSPDFLRQAQSEARVQALCARLLRGKEHRRHSPPETNRHVQRVRESEE